MRFTALVFLFVALFSPFVFAQSAQPSSTPRRRSSTPHPLPTSINEVTDPDLLASLTSSQTRSRARRQGQKIHGVGHEADMLPITNAERLRMGLPLKPPAQKPKDKSAVSEASPSDIVADNEGNRLESGTDY